MRQRHFAERGALLNGSIPCLPLLFQTSRTWYTNNTTHDARGREPQNSGAPKIEDLYLSPIHLSETKRPPAFAGGLLTSNRLLQQIRRRF